MSLPLILVAAIVAGTIGYAKGRTDGVDVEHARLTGQKLHCAWRWGPCTWQPAGTRRKPGG